MTKRKKDAQVPTKIDQPHGGALLSGGVPGNRGGGRLAWATRLRMRGTLWEILEQIDAYRARLKRCPKCKAEPITVGDQLRMADFYAKYGLGTPKADIPDDLIAALAADVRAETDDMDVLQRIYDRWKYTIGAYLTGNLEGA